MKWSNVKLIFLREVTDQLRDRRMLFMVAVLPLLLYPLLGMTFMQITQFIKEHPTRVWVLGAEHLPVDHPLFAQVESDGEKVWRFRSNYFASSQEVDLLEIELSGKQVSPGQLDLVARQNLAAGNYDAVLYFPPDFGQRLAEFRQAMEAREQGAGDRPPSEEQATEPEPAADTTRPLEKIPTVPEPLIIFNAAKDKSRIAHDRLGSVLAQWRDEIRVETIRMSPQPQGDSAPFGLSHHDVASPASESASLWSKILPFVLLIWALTGAFYPAIDLCAGEKERGTLETLLSSPALRNEIVWGKLFTVMLFSVATSLLNLFSMGLTGTFILHQMQGMGSIPLGPPPLLSLAWLVVAVVPIAALFSALSLALAAMARSTKEGQYYLMPLLMVTMPLMLVPLLPAAELDLGKSLIPVSGMMLLLRSLMEGRYLEALKYSLPVILITGVCCHFAIRWAVAQFNNESVIFREGERFSLGRWMTHLVRDRGDTPSPAEAAMCGVLLLVIGFFARLAIRPNITGPTWEGVALSTFVLQMAFIAAPVLIMAIVLTRKPSKTLLLRLPRPLSLPAAAALAICIHPVVISLVVLLRTLYPLKGEDALVQFSNVLNQAPLWQVLLIMALIPAICEELAFRGFILSGLRHMGHKWGAIALSSLFFGVAHTMAINQSMSAFMLGMVIGFIAVQTGSILPGMVFHVLHNSLLIGIPKLVPWVQKNLPWFNWMFQEDPEFVYSWPLVAVSGVLTIGLLFWFRSEPYQQTEEERLQSALDHQRLPAA